MDNLESTFKDFDYFFANFASEKLINKFAQQFKQKLIDKSRGGKLDLEDPGNMSFVLGEFFISTIMANREMLALYHNWLVNNFEIKPKED
ncbi:hypothetical protein [Clostridium sp. UBA1652]|uniref:hypothetical protein n=1 Tax=Clostridium sp. UBA1652 TaxID=1946348 RepID=UPI00257A79FB|nr:hypothetical protein [Clostridium sp. UBA1652]